MSYLFDMILVGPIVQIGQLQGFGERIPDTHRRAEISDVFTNGGS